VLLLGLGVVICGDDAMVQTALGQVSGIQRERTAENTIMAFDIPSLPLAAALETFGGVTQIQMFYESSLVVGRRSSPVRGEMGIKPALALLLKGTGLSVASFDRGTITILAPPRTASVAELAQLKSRTREFYPYLAAIQDSLGSSFCKVAAGWKEPVEVLARLWIGPSGGVSRAELVSSTGSDERDRAYTAALRALPVGVPPTTMPQPVTLMILPRDGGQSGGCPGASRSAAHE